MSRASVVPTAIALLVLAGFVFGPVGVAQEPRVPGPALGPFLTVVKKSNAASSIDLEKVRVEKLDGRSFLVGVGADTPDNWQKGKTIWVALDDVSEMTVFATLDELRKAGQLPDAPKPEVPPKR